MHIEGFQKTTLLDYPGKLAATIFTSSCNLRCPFCHNADLVLHPGKQPAFEETEVLAQLKKRSGILEGVCVTGGEPTLYPDLPEFLSQIQSLGLSVKLDTNGTNPAMLAQLMKDHHVDYVAMDIKNSPEKYALTTGRNIDLDAIRESVNILKEGRIPYEFRTTVIREFHTAEDFTKIGQWLEGADQYFLQNFVNSDRLICPDTFSSYTKEELTAFLPLLTPYIAKVSLRGID